MAPRKNTSEPTYKEFVRSHGGKSTARLAEQWKNRFGDGGDGQGVKARVDARNAGGAQQPGNEAITPGFELPRALQPPVGGAPPTPPSTTGDIPTAQPPSAAAAPSVGPETAAPSIPTGPSPDQGSLAMAVQDFVRGGQAGMAAPMDNPAVQQPGDPEGSYRAFEGAPPQMGPTTEPAQMLAEQERDPALDLILQRYKQGMG